MEHISAITARVMAEIAKKRLEAFEKKLAKEALEAKKKEAGLK